MTVLRENEIVSQWLLSAIFNDATDHVARCCPPTTSMADSAPAMLHKINSPYDWPHELDDVIRRLHSPLPPSFANIVNATTSEFRQFVQTTLDQSRLETLAPEERVLASVSQSILSTVASLECLAGYEAADGLPRPKLPLVHSLIRAIAHASDENHRFL